VIVKYGLKAEFGAAPLAEATSVPETVIPEMMEGRTDYRKVPTFTIDGEDAKDFDDAISVERLDGSKDGLLRVGVHIADVSYYVAEGTSLDKEAQERATSVYLPGSVLPMLPEELSNGICSLIEGEPRLALSALMDVTRSGEVKAFQFVETVIQSDARLTYQQVQEFAEGGRLPTGKRKLERDIKVLLNLSQELRNSRIGAGALDFDFTEAKVDVDDQGALHVTPVKSNAARRLIEELMLLANRKVAEELSRRDVPALYRVHEGPTPEKQEILRAYLKAMGVGMSTSSMPAPRTCSGSCARLQARRRLSSSTRCCCAASGRPATAARTSATSGWRSTTTCTSPAPSGATPTSSCTGPCGRCCSTGSRRR